MSYQCAHAELDPSEPTYLTNRAAAYMSLRRFKPALTDCQLAADLQSASPSPKTLVRLARCQLSTGSTAPALSTLRSALAIEPKNDAALQLQKKVEELEKHLRNHQKARQEKNWAMARLALDKCVQSIEAEGGDIPIQWRCWKVEVELSRGNWDAAGIAAKYVSSLPNLLPAVYQNLTCVLREATHCGWNPTHQMCSRCGDSSCS